MGAARVGRVVVLLAVAIGVFPAAAVGAGWSVVASPNVQLPQGVVQGVSCASAGACTAVGYYDDAAGREVTLAERWNGTKWSIQPTPNPPGASANSQLLGVSCASADACTAVGYTTNGAPNTGTKTMFAEQWDGTSWSIHTTPNPPDADESELLGVSCASADACTAVGYYDNGHGTTAMLAERWNGTKWSIQATPNPPGANYSELLGVSCSLADACTAVGDYEDSAFADVTLAERWNGTKWSIQATPNPPGADESKLLGVSCASANACTAVGYYFTSGINVMLAERWDGTKWLIQTTANPPGANYSELLGVSCSSADACTAVGDYEDTGGTKVILAQRWDGTKWSIQTTPNPTSGDASSDVEDSKLFGVSCPSASACTVVGDYLTRPSNNFGRDITLAERWNGTSWSIQTTANPTGAAESRLFGVSCLSADACTAVGYQIDSAGYDVPLAERWDGTNWSIQTTPTPNGGTQDSKLYGVSCSSASACTAVGYYDNSDVPDAPISTLAERWDGTRWSIQSTPNPTGPVGVASELLAVSCAAADACTAVGRRTRDYNGNAYLTLAERWDGTRWSIQTTPDPAGAQSTVLQGLSCTSTDACTAIGAYENSAESWLTLAERWDGTRWSIQTTPNPTAASYLQGVSCTTASACTAVGNYYTSQGVWTLAERWDGTKWSTQTTPTPPNGSILLDVSCASATACTAVGFNNFPDEPLAERWDGTSWSIQTTPTPPENTDFNELRRVSCASADACTAVGAYNNVNNLGSWQTLAERYDASGGGSGPSSSSLPVISGTAKVGHRISASTGSWSGTAPISYRYQWQLCKPGCTNIARATASTLTLTAAAARKRVRVLVTASNTVGSAQAASREVGPVVPAGPTSAQVRAALLKVLVPSGNGARIAQLLKHRSYSCSFTAPSAGRLMIAWYLVPKGAHITKAKKPVLVASSSVVLHKTGRATIKIVLTADGRKLLKGVKHLKLTAKGTFMPTGQAATSTTKTFTLKQ